LSILLFFKNLDHQPLEKIFRTLKCQQEDILELIPDEEINDGYTVEQILNSLITKKLLRYS